MNNPPTTVLVMNSRAYLMWAYARLHEDVSEAPLSR